MNLHEFFARYPTSYIEMVAQRAGSSLAYVQHLKYGNRRPSAEMAMRLEQASGGELRAEELRPDLPWPKRRTQ